MRRTLKTALGVFVLFATLGAGVAEAQPGCINARERYQRHRIWSGYSHGSLTRPEARHLFRQQYRTERVERHLRSDGYLSPSERGRLDYRLDRQSAAIWSNRHDGWTR